MIRTKTEVTIFVRRDVGENKPQEIHIQVKAVDADLVEIIAGGYLVTVPAKEIITAIKTVMEPEWE